MANVSSHQREAADALKQVIQSITRSSSFVLDSRGGEAHGSEVSRPFTWEMHNIGLLQTALKAKAQAGTILSNASVKPWRHCDPSQRSSSI